jgi:hypothetical protein
MIRLVLILVAFLATCYATVSFLTNMDADFQVSALLAAACLLGVVLLNQAEHVRNCRIEAGRRAVWARRDREEREGQGC